MAYTLNDDDECKVEIFLILKHRVLNKHQGSGGRTLRILDLDTARRCVVTSRGADIPRYLLDRSLCGLQSHYES
jgi:hypothetical protein